MRPLILTVLLLPTIWNLSASSVKRPQDEKSGIIAENAKPVLISDQFKFTEGPAVNKNGDIFFTDIVEGKIWKYSTEGELSLFMDKTGYSDGMYFDKKGNLITAVMNKISLFLPPKQTFALDAGIAICSIFLPSGLKTVTPPRPVR